MNNDQSSAQDDLQLMQYTERLQRKTAGLQVYLRIRAVAGLILMLFAFGALSLSVTFALSGLDLIQSELLRPWTAGFSAVLATFMPAALAWLAGITGWTWWRFRHLDDHARERSSA